MIVVRLARGGAKKRPFYHIVVSDARKPRDSGYLERLGYFNPSAVGGETPVHLDRERLSYWLSQGVQLSERVSSIVRKLDKGESFSPDKKRRVKARTKARANARAAKDAEETPEATAHPDTQPTEPSEPTEATPQAASESDEQSAEQTEESSQAASESGN